MRYGMTRPNKKRWMIFTNISMKATVRVWKIPSQPKCKYIYLYLITMIFMSEGSKRVFKFIMFLWYLLSFVLVCWFSCDILLFLWYMSKFLSREKSASNFDLFLYLFELLILMDKRLVILKGGIRIV